MMFNNLADQMNFLMDLKSEIKELKRASSNWNRQCT